MKRPLTPVLIFLACILVLMDRQLATADCRSFSSLIRNGGYALADRRGQVISSCNENKPFIPASILKIPLALAAFDILGPAYRFVTEFFVDRQNNIYIRGYGDPFLVSEEVDLILDRLVAAGVDSINGIFIDNTSAQLDEQVPGRGTSSNPYDVPISSVAVNFNTVNILVHDNGKIESAEAQTPTLPIMQELGRELSPGQYRLNVCSLNCLPEKESARYTAQLFRALQKKKGITGDGPIGTGTVPAGMSPVYIHRNSRNLEEVVFQFLKFSNNFAANQVFLRCGAEKYGAPATWDKARKAVADSLGRQLGPYIAGNITMEEGSGLSRRNRITAAAMLKVLEKFRPYASLLQEKYNAHIKSGTLGGVYNYAGYLADKRPFVILLNQAENTRDALLQHLQEQ